MSNNKNDWSILSKQIHDELNVIKRDALVPYVISTDNDIENARDLYEKLLIDVEMGSCGTISKIKEAISAVQLYLHRYFVNLEDPEVKDGKTPEKVKEELKTWWKWLKNYRVWEANRKVFLYPENYIRPELRDTKTPAFKTLEEDLLQGEITEASVQRAYKKYLDEYTEVSRLTMAGGYVYSPSDTNNEERHLVLFGRTKTDPRRYYYRFAEFKKDSVLWKPWLSVNVQIDADRVYPVFAFGRVFVFWTKIETQLEDTSNTAITTKTEGDTQTVSSKSQATYCLKIYYSFYNLNQEWVSSQQLTEVIQENSQIKDAKLFVENSEKLILQGESADHENIVISCTYKVEDQEKTNAFSLTPELYSEKANKPGFHNNGKEIFGTIFDEPKIDDRNIVMLNTSEKSTDGPWFSFDHKGGSFLCKPDIRPLSEDIWPKSIVETLGEDLNIPQEQWNTIGWQDIDAAVQIPEGTIYLFNGEEYVTVKDGNVSAKKAIKKQWGKVSNNIIISDIVDSAFFDGEKTYLFSSNEYLVYSNGLELADFGSPKLLENNSDSLPKWEKIDAVFKKENKTYFFNNSRQIYVVSDALTEEKSTKEFWGKPNKSLEFFAGITSSIPLIDAAFVRGDDTYLINQKQFIKYKNGNYELAESGYPKEHTFYAVLEDIECQNNNDSYQEQRIVAAYDFGSEIHFTTEPINGTGQTNYVFSEGSITESDENNRWIACFALNNITYKFQDNQLFVSEDNPRNLAFSINAAFVGKDNEIYLFKGEEYISFSKFSRAKAQTIVNSIAEWDRSSKTIKDKWGKVTNNIIETGIVDAGFYDGHKTYLFSGNQYFVYSGNDGDIDAGYPKLIENNQENLPQWNKIDAVLTTDGNDKKYFFNNSSQTFVESENLGTEIKTQDQWGKVRNNFTEQGKVDAAYATEKYLFLTSGNQFIRYDLSPQENEQKLGIYIDSGYPKLFGTSNISKIDAAFKLNEKIYLFSNDRYSKLENGNELDSNLSFNYIQGNWGNLPYELRAGVDAALNVTIKKEENQEDNLYILKDGQYIKYTDDVKPYEISDVPYKIIRLTTSTAYILNQKLFAGGVAKLLSLETQEKDDIPTFKIVTAKNTKLTEKEAATTIKVLENKVKTNQLPISSHLDFDSANGIYYWEIFFHAPFLIAQSLNTGQKFEKAKTWYEYIFDPTEVSNYWKFLPFFAVEIPVIIHSVETALKPLKDLLPNNNNLTEIENNFNKIFDKIKPLIDVFRNIRQLSEEQEQDFTTYFSSLRSTLKTIQNKLQELPQPSEAENFNQSVNKLQELTGIIGKLWYRYYKLMKVKDSEIDTYLNDPFDAHAIATLRKTAYRKAIVMAYIDNIIDWGDMLFRQYTQESINEARMLYILAYDLLGRKPENLGTKILSPDKKYSEITNDPSNYDDFREDLPILPHVGNQPIIATPSSNGKIVKTANNSVANRYFFVPANPLFNDYWNRVEDRLYKIRHGLNIMGISQPLPLFEPPIDPMALVQAASSGAGLSAALSSLNIAVPHYRFSFMVRKAQELVGKLSQFGGELLGTLEKKDAEDLSMLQNRQEGIILGMTRSIKEAQLEEAKYNVTSLKESLESAKNQVKHYDKLLKEGLTSTESAQIGLMIAGSTLMTVAAIGKIATAIAYGLGKTHIGPFTSGYTTGGETVGKALESTTEALETGGDALSTIAEVIGIYAQHERTVQDWELQKSMADSDVKQITAQIEGAKQQEIIAQQEIKILEKEIEQNESIKTFMKEKFTNAQLYQWMVSKLSGMYYQTYQMAYDMAKAAEKAFEFERGMKESEVNFINGIYWDSQKKGLLAGESLGLDLDRMEKAYIESDRRGFEISKNISLLELDPVALLNLKSKGVCEFAFTEALFDYDFPGHYCRQIKTISLTFNAGKGQTVMATLTQLNHKTILEADSKAVKFLLNPKDQPPLSIRSNWRANQQIALSHVEDYETNNGLFELRFDDERYLPFEGTGAVSNWRLELNGKKGSYNVNELLDITINLKYTAEQGGQAFAKAVKGMLKPYPTVRLFNMNDDFPNQWKEFLDSESNELVLRFNREMFPNMGSSKISGIFTKFDLHKPGQMSMTLNYQDDWPLRDGQYLLTPGLSVSSRGSEWALTIKGDKRNLRNINLVLGYQATVT